MSVRMTEAMRRRVQKHIVHKHFEERWKTLKEQEYQIAHDIYTHIYDEKTILMMESLPVGFLPCPSNLELDMNLNYNHRKFQFRPSLSYRAPFQVARYLRLGVNGQQLTDDLRKRVRQHVKDVEKCHDQQTELSNEVGAALCSATTLGGLLKNWPEAAELIKQALPDVDFSTGKKTGKELAVKFTTLNTMLGLKPVQEESKS